MDGQSETLRRALEVLELVCGKTINSAPNPRTAACPTCSSAMPSVDPEAWRDSFASWVTAACLFRDRCFGGIGSLHIHFCEWALTHDDPCTRQAFETLLNDAGFLFADGLVYGLILKEDAAWQVFLKTEGRKQ